MKKQDYLFGFDILMDDLMVNIPQLAAYIGVSRSALNHMNTGRNKPGSKILADLTQLSNLMNVHILEPQTFRETRVLSKKLLDDKKNQIEAQAVKTNYLISATKEDLKEMEEKHEHAVRAFNNLQYILHNSSKLDAAKKFWLTRHMKLCEKTAFQTTPLLQLKLKMKLASLKAELKVMRGDQGDE
jgi:hypothetical protein